MSNNKGTTFKAPVNVLAKVIKHVMSSVAEAETIVLFMNAQDLLVPL